jgi:hypothetical protein
MNIGQIKRFLAELSLDFDPLPVLYDLKCWDMVKQGVNQTGIIYEAAEKGRAALDSKESLQFAQERLRVAAYADKARPVYLRERDYLAQYTESSTSIVSVFLSIRDAGKIVLKISILVPDVSAAQAICRDWMRRSPAAYDAVWAAIAGDAPQPPYWKNRPPSVAEEETHAR